MLRSRLWIEAMDGNKDEEVDPAAKEMRNNQTEEARNQETGAREERVSSER